MFLTIAIPTYNRLRYLKDSLPEIIRQCKPYPEIEILVSDNNSSDGTWDYLCDIMPRTKNLCIRTNSRNVGGEENHVLSVESSKGEYVWVFGDDESLLPDAVDMVMMILKNEWPDLLVVGDENSSHPYFNGTFTEYLQDSTLSMLINQTLISCNIFWKELFDSEVARQYEHTNYGHKYSLMNSLKKGGTIRRVSAPVISVREDRAGTWDNLHWIRVKQLVYLRFLGISYTKIIAYIYTGIIVPAIRRRV